MAQWDYEQFLNHIEKGELLSGYLLFGPEIYLIENSLKVLKDRIFQNSIIDFNLDVLYGDEIDLEKLEMSLETLPMMGGLRMVILKNAHLMKSAELDAVNELITAPFDTTVFVMVFDNIDQRKKIFKDIFKKMVVVHFPHLMERQIPQWVLHIAKGYNKKVSQEASVALQNLIGVNLIDIKNEIEKLSLYVGDRELIEIKDVESIVSKYKMDSIFELTDAIGTKNIEKSFTIQRYLLEQGESEVGILAMITRHLRILLLAREAIDQKVPSSSVASYIGVPPYFVNQYLQQSKQWSPSRLRSAYKSLLNTDRRLKSFSVNPENFLIENILTLFESPA